MDARGQHSLKQIERRFDMRYSRFDTPGAKARRIDLFRDRNGPVLMPTERPVHFGILVEQDGPDRPRLWAEAVVNQPP